MSATKSRPFSIRLAEEYRQALQAEADKRGLAIGELGRMFIVEKLKESESPPVVKELRSLAALIIASLSDTIFLEDAERLVETHRQGQEQTP